MKAWGGRASQEAVAYTLANKGTTCHLCGLPGADSADHDPPRSELLAAGVPNPDALVYLFPAHRIPCNVGRGTRPITDELRAELRAAREQHEAMGQPVGVSPRFRVVTS